ncbi:hypothetical protein [Alkalihalobacillus trypoxylicola]|uniref:Uncharacterized protein n=1 Tax=Alkalihalobacillus trypoxylicola TaxID=519424 RepID=A0A161QGR1_9BACI|nr:hypothetical protein [Alkalihalobacillus trypoxylicola]KYG28150.1 hypothetical protein AZF04_09610 [Alkalihalobacillus trypoxylicola]
MTVREVYVEAIKEGFKELQNVILVCIHKQVVNWTDPCENLNKFFDTRYTKRFLEVMKEIGIGGNNEQTIGSHK